MAEERNHSNQLVKEFKISIDQARTHKPVATAHDAYKDAKAKFKAAVEEAEEAKLKLRQTLAPRLLKGDFGVPSNIDRWTLTENEDEEVFHIQVWERPRKRGKFKAKIPTETLPPLTGEEIELGEGNAEPVQKKSATMADKKRQLAALKSRFGDTATKDLALGLGYDDLAHMAAAYEEDPETVGGQVAEYIRKDTAA